MALHDIVQPHIATIEHDGRKLDITCRIAFDGVEYVGRLWFADTDRARPDMPDRGAIPGRTREEIVKHAQQLTPPELALRYRRALAERRRYLELRRVTDEILTKIRYLNQVAISIQSGVLDQDNAAQEFDVTEKQLHELVAQLRYSAGVETENQ
jgi:hypothetical protein